MMVIPIENHVEQQLNAYSLKDFTFIVRNPDNQLLEIKLKEFLKKLPTLKKKLDKLKFKQNGSDEGVESVYRLLRP